jgi:hypothetical protein
MIASCPECALEVSLLALHWIAQGQAPDHRSDCVAPAWKHARAAAERLRTSDRLDERISTMATGTSEDAQRVKRMLSFKDDAFRA